MRSIRAFAPAIVALLCLATGARAVEAPKSAAAPLELSAYRGKVIYLDFWASWCAPCRESFPWMNRLQRRFGPDGLVVIAVNVDRERADAERFLQTYPADFRIVFDPDGVLPEKFAVHGMPTSFLIDREGQVRLRHEGFFIKQRDALTREVQTVVLAH